MLTFVTIRRWSFSVLVTAFLAAAPASAVLNSDLSNVIVYPNPFQTSLSHTGITFDNLTRSARVRIYKITGEMVADFPIDSEDGTLLWNVRNSDGEPVVTGVYIYVVTNSLGQKALGKLMIIK